MVLLDSREYKVAHFRRLNSETMHEFDKTSKRYYKTLGSKITLSSINTHCQSPRGLEVRSTLTSRAGSDRFTTRFALMITLVMTAWYLIKTADHVRIAQSW